MGLRFKKSIKVAPGVKINLNKNSVSATVGTKGAHYTVNSKGQKTASVGIPGTGISYAETIDSGKKASKSKSSSNSASTDNGNNKKSGGCLTSILLFCLAIAVISFVATYAWIPGVIAIIYFAKKTSDPKQKKIRIGLSAVVTLISFIIFLSSLFAPELTDMTVTWDKTEYDITEEAVLDISVQEEGADIYSLEISDNDVATVSYIDDVATVHFISEGTADIFFIANNEIESNVTTITVTDKEAEEQRRLEEERIAKEKAEEEARLKAEKEAEEKAAKEAKKQAKKEKEERKNIIVYVTNSGSKYHSAGCRHLKSEIEMKLSDAVKNYEPCGVCHPPTL